MEKHEADMDGKNGALTRREWLERVGRTAVGAAAAGSLSSCMSFLCCRDTPKRRPNFVFLLTDDQSYATLGCTGNPFMKTPNLDRLAREGALFKNAFVTLSLCSPSRATFLTGLYPHTHGVMANRIPLDENLPTLPTILRGAGYEIAHIGKWHLYNQDRIQPLYDYWAAQENQGGYVDPKKNINGKWTDLEGYDTDIITDQAVNFIRRERGETPFCLWMGYKAPHYPFMPAERHASLFGDVTFKPADSYYKDDPGKPRRVRQRRGKWVPPRPPNLVRMPLEEWEEYEHQYYRSIMAVDESVGRVLGVLEKQGILDDTIIVFTSDQGLIHSEHGIMQDKRELYEESIRAPMLARYPRRIKGGQVIREDILNIDLAPTILDFCGLPIPSHMQGRSWRPLVAGETMATPWRDACLFEFFTVRTECRADKPTIKGIRTDRYKLILNLNPPDIEELYDLKEDPRELRNLAQDPAHRKTVAELKRRMMELMKEYDDPARPLVEATL